MTLHVVVIKKYGGYVNMDAAYFKKTSLDCACHEIINYYIHNLSSVIQSRCIFVPESILRRTSFKVSLSISGQSLTFCALLVIR